MSREGCSAEHVVLEPMCEVSQQHREERKLAEHPTNSSRIIPRAPTPPRRPRHLRQSKAHSTQSDRLFRLSAAHIHRELVASLFGTLGRP